MSLSPTIKVKGHKCAWACLISRQKNCNVIEILQVWNRYNGNQDTFLQTSQGWLTAGKQIWRCDWFCTTKYYAIRGRLFVCQIKVKEGHLWQTSSFRRYSRRIIVAVYGRFKIVVRVRSAIFEKRSRSRRNWVHRIAAPSLERIFCEQACLCPLHALNILGLQFLVPDIGSSFAILRRRRCESRRR